MAEPQRRERRRRRPRRRFRSRGGGPIPPPARRKHFGQPDQHQGHGGGRGPGQGGGDTDQVSATVATPGNEGTAGPEFDSGDMTGTDEIQAVFSQGTGFAPQLHYGSNEAFQQQTADNVASASQTGEA